MTNDSLKGWKEIAGFLQTSVRTAERWEQDLGLPVRRVTGIKKDLVFADPADLLRWRQGQQATWSTAAGQDDGPLSADARLASVFEGEAPTGGARSRFRTWIGIAALVVVLSASGLFVWTQWAQLAARRVTPDRVQTPAGVERVTAEPTSNTVSLMRAVVGGDNPRPFLVGVFDGGMASIAAEQGPSFGLLVGRRADELTVFVVLLAPTRAQEGGTARQVGTLR
jgi:hypothetical protein